MKIIMITSGKGGVGKTTTTVNIALNMKQRGINVGIMDCDIQTPSVKTAIEEIKSDLIIPFWYLEEDNFISSKKSYSFFKKTIQEASDKGLEYLLLDLPPSIMDSHIQLLKTFFIKKAISVGIESKLSKKDVEKVKKYFEKENVEFICHVNNMSDKLSDFNILKLENFTSIIPLFYYNSIVNLILNTKIMDYDLTYLDSSVKLPVSDIKYETLITNKDFYKKGLWFYSIESWEQCLDYFSYNDMKNKYIGVAINDKELIAKTIDVYNNNDYCLLRTKLPINLATTYGLKINIFPFCVYYVENIHLSKINYNLPVAIIKHENIECTLFLHEFNILEPNYIGKEYYLYSEIKNCYYLPLENFSECVYTFHSLWNTPDLDSEKLILDYKNYFNL